MPAAHDGEVAEAERLDFWARQARRLSWAKEPVQTLDWSNPPFAKWFADGELDVAYNCVDRHVQAGRGERIALHFEGEPGDSRTISYAELKGEVCRAANALTELGVGNGDRVAIYLPMIPEAVIAMLACARIGAVHSVVFGGFSADAVASRITDADARLVITADGGYRRGKPSALKSAIDDAVARCPQVAHVVVVRRTGQDVQWNNERDIWWHEITTRQSTEHAAQPFGAEHPLFILYTSGTTGKPKGILHTSGGYLTQAGYTHQAVFDLKPATDVYWCTADIGWITGHSYIVYGPLSNGATQVIYEGTPDTPHRGRFWEIVQKDGVALLYTAPTAIRTFMRWGDEIPAGFDLTSLRVLGSVGEPINPEAWLWYREHIGGSRTPVVDTWWQTETGAMMICPLPGTETKPGSAHRPLPGIAATVVDDQGTEVPDGSGGYLVLTEPWPSMLRTVWGDDQRYIETYWSKFPGRYFAGDGASKDEDGDIWLLGRVDDVMLVSGHNISTAEVEAALNAHPDVAESVVGAADATTGQAVVAFAVLRERAQDGAGLSPRLREHVGRTLGQIAKPQRILIVSECRRPARERSCAVFYATSPRTGSWETSPPSPTPP